MPARPDSRLLVEVQALRALAVALVVIFHLWPNRLPGGYIGVDVFFVISGFLITKHLLQEVERTQRVKVFAFWARRLRRLLPASLLVLAASAVGVMLLVPLNFWEFFLKEITASALYVQNWVLAAASVNYWAADIAPSTARHYWSLSVEEQFYLVWPLLIVLVLWAVRRFRRAAATPAGYRRAVAQAMAALFALSLAYSVYETAANPSAAYYETPTRVWEFALGGLLVFLVNRKPASQTLRSVLSWAGIAAIAVTAVLYSGRTPFPGWAALVPTLGTAVVIWMGAPKPWWSIRPVSSLRPMLFLGDTSYSVYLWHWPLIVLLPWATGRPLGTLDKVGIIVATVTLAWLTKKYVEDPLRSAPVLTRHRSRPTFAAAALGMAVVVALGVGGAAGSQNWITGNVAQAQAASVSNPCLGAAAELPGASCAPSTAAAVPNALAVSKDFDLQIEQCFSQDPNPAVIKCTFGDPNSRTAYALIGDSHAGALAPAFMRMAVEAGWRLDVYLKPGCPWSQVTRERSDNNFAAIANCSTWEQAVSQQLIDNGPYTAVVATAYAVVSNFIKPAPGKDAYTTAVDAYRATWAKFRAASPARIVVIRDTPNWPTSPVDCLIAAKGNPGACTVSRAEAFSVPDPQADAAANTPGVSVVDLTDILCKGDTCPAVIGGVTVYRDQNHLSDTFAKSLTRILRDRVAAAVASG